MADFTNVEFKKINYFIFFLIFTNFQGLCGTLGILIKILLAENWEIFYFLLCKFKGAICEFSLPLNVVSCCDGDGH